MSPQPQHVWLVTGSSSGFGRAIVEAALARGHHVIATARDPSTLTDLDAGSTGRLQAIGLDVTDAASIERAVTTAIGAMGRIDVLVNNAGYGLLGAVEDLDERELRLSYETQLFGPLNLARAVLPAMRRQGFGRIVQMSSVVGVTSGAGGSAYAGPKAALEAASEALAAEVAPFGVRVLIVEPGAFRTEFTGRSLRVTPPSAPYAPSLGPASDAFQAGHGTQAGDPRRGAEAIVAAVALDDPPLRLPLGDDAFEWLDAYLKRRVEALETARELGADTAFRNSPGSR